MMNGIKTASELWKLGCKINDLQTHRLCAARHEFGSDAESAVDTFAEVAVGDLTSAWSFWVEYSTDCWQRSVLFWDTLRQRGNNFLEHERAGKPPLLVYEYEIIADGRQLDRPVNYALIKIKPPAGIEIDERKRPIIIVDPRAGHGPGIGGFKQDSQVGVALKAGHPVYFVIFFTHPEPGGEQ